jgi:membrane-bound ClpP family serine protease
MLTAGSILVIDRHVIAGISIAGTVCDVMGGLYLAYDLLGGNNGPRRMGAFGIVILLIGLILQSIQYWTVLLNIVIQ